MTNGINDTNIPKYGVVILNDLPLVTLPSLVCSFCSLDGNNVFVTNNCETNPTQISSNNVEIIINSNIKIGCWLNIGKELITEIPAGTNKKLILFVNAVPTPST